MLDTKENLNHVKGHKSALNNPNISDEANRLAQAVHDQDIGDEKDLTRIAAGRNAAQHSSDGINLGKTKAYEELIRKGGETPEE